MLSESRAPHAAAAVVAAGRGRRMQAAGRKQYLQLAGVPILRRTLEAFAACALIRHIYLVIPRDDFAYCRREILPPAAKTPITLVAGGAERQHSVANAIAACDAAVEILVVHDGVRPFVTAGQIAACIGGASETGACILALPAVETVKQVDTSGRIQKTLPRDTLWLAQTPQAFRLALIRQAHRQVAGEKPAGTDDAMLVERLGVSVKVIPGSRYNLKITTREDLLLAEALLQSGQLPL